MPPKHPLAIPRKPQGIVTRGKTARNRLRQVDNFLLLYEPSLIARRDSSLFVDLGYGAEAFTTLETAMRFRKLNPDLKILGVEIEPERVAAGLPFADERTFFRLGGFNLPIEPGETVRAIRTFNVLRQYNEAEVLPAWEQMAHYVQPGGLMIEGTSNPTGAIQIRPLRRAARALRRHDQLRGRHAHGAVRHPRCVAAHRTVRRRAPGRPVGRGRSHGRARPSAGERAGQGGRAGARRV